MRCADPRTGDWGQGPARRVTARGAAVVLALVTVFLCASLASAVIASVGRSIEVADGLSGQAQARLLARAAVDWARNVLSDDRRRTAIDHLQEPWAVRVPPTPVGEAEVAGEIVELSGRYNLNNLIRNGAVDEAAVARVVRLLVLLDVAEPDAEERVRTLAEAMQPPRPEELFVDALTGARSPERAIFAGGLYDLRELSRLDGFDARLIAALAEVAAVTPSPSPVNLNTAPAEVLHAVVDGLSLDAARVLVSERASAWYRSVSDFTARLPPGATLPSDVADVRSRFFLVTGRARYGDTVTAMEVLLDRRQNWADILWQRLI